MELTDLIIKWEKDKVDYSFIIEDKSSREKPEEEVRRIFSYCSRANFDEDKKNSIFSYLNHLIRNLANIISTEKDASKDISSELLRDIVADHSVVCFNDLETHKKYYDRKAVGKDPEEKKRIVCKLEVLNRLPPYTSPAK